MDTLTTKVQQIVSTNNLGNNALLGGLALMMDNLAGVITALVMLVAPLMAAIAKRQKMKIEAAKAAQDLKHQENDENYEMKFKQVELDEKILELQFKKRKFELELSKLSENTSESL